MYKKIIKILIILSCLLIFIFSSCQAINLTELEKRAADLNHDGLINYEDLDLVASQKSPDKIEDGIEAINEYAVYLFKTESYGKASSSAFSGGLLEAANKVHEDEINWHYSVGGDLFWNDIDRSLNNPNCVTCCATYVSCVLYTAGFFNETEMNSFNYNLCSTLYNFLYEHGFQRIDAYSQLEAGDIVFLSYGGGYDHVQIYAGDGTWFNAGSTDAIQKVNPYNQGDFASANFYVALRSK